MKMKNQIKRGLRRPCKVCEEMFQPTTRGERICLKCWEELRVSPKNRGRIKNPKI